MGFEGGGRGQEDPDSARPAHPRSPLKEGWPAWATGFQGYRRGQKEVQKHREETCRWEEGKMWSEREGLTAPLLQDSNLDTVLTHCWGLTRASPGQPDSPGARLPGPRRQLVLAQRWRPGCRGDPCPVASSCPPGPAKPDAFWPPRFIPGTQQCETCLPSCHCPPISGARINHRRCLLPQAGPGEQGQSSVPAGGSRQVGGPGPPDPTAVGCPPGGPPSRAAQRLPPQQRASRWKPPCSPSCPPRPHAVLRAQMRKAEPARKAAPCVSALIPSQLY